MNSRRDIIFEIMNLDNQILKYQNEIATLETKKAIILKNKFKLEIVHAQNSRLNYSRFYYSNGKNVGKEFDYRENLQELMKAPLDKVELLIKDIENVVEIFKWKISDCYNRKARLSEQLSRL